MIEKVFKMSSNEKGVIEPIIKDNNINYMHMVLLEGEKLKTHYTNANVYMTVREGILSISLEDGEFVKYNKNTILLIPYNTKMDVRNYDSLTLELIVIKAPAPGKFYEN